MPSKSKAQQRLMGAAYAAKKNKTPLKELSPEIQKLVQSMNKKQLKEFAKTETSDLPEHTKAASFEQFVKAAMCGKTDCPKMNNKNDDCCVRDKQIQYAGGKVKIIESLGGVKPVKSSKKATALNLKQYALKKKASWLPMIAGGVATALPLGWYGYNKYKENKQNKEQQKLLQDNLDYFKNELDAWRGIGTGAVVGGVVGGLTNSNMAGLASGAATAYLASKPELRQKLISSVKDIYRNHVKPMFS
jgi:hypothetical protein